MGNARIVFGIGEMEKRDDDNICVGVTNMRTDYVTINQAQQCLDGVGEAGAVEGEEVLIGGGVPNMRQTRQLRDVF